MCNHIEITQIKTLKHTNSLFISSIYKPSVILSNYFGGWLWVIFLLFALRMNPPASHTSNIKSTSQKAPPS